MVADGVIPEHEVWLMCVCTCTYMSVKRAKEDFSLRCSQSEVLLEHSHRDHSVDDLILRGQDSKQKSGLRLRPSRHQGMEECCKPGVCLGRPQKEKRRHLRPDFEVSQHLMGCGVGKSAMGFRK